LKADLSDVSTQEIRRNKKKTAQKSGKPPNFGSERVQV
jgi:hypothetical protein